MAATVTFGGTPATDVVVISDTEITATTPAGAVGPVDVVVTTGGGSGTLPDGYTYLGIEHEVVPICGPTGFDTEVTITIDGATSLDTPVVVTVGGDPATVTDVTGGVVTATVAAGSSGPVIVTPAGGSPIDTGDSFVSAPAPDVDAVDPTTGATGSSVTITGTNLDVDGLLGAPEVRFGTEAAEVTAMSATELTVTVPAAATGTVDVTVQHCGGTSTLTDGFTVA